MLILFGFYFVLLAEYLLPFLDTLNPCFGMKYVITALMLWRVLFSVSAFSVSKLSVTAKVESEATIAESATVGSSIGSSTAFFVPFLSMNG